MSDLVGYTLLPALYFKGEMVYYANWWLMLTDFIIY